MLDAMYRTEKVNVNLQSTVMLGIHIISDGFIEIRSM